MFILAQLTRLQLQSQHVEFPGNLAISNNFSLISSSSGVQGFLVDVSLLIFDENKNEILRSEKLLFYFFYFILFICEFLLIFK